MATTLVRIQLLSKTSTDFATANPVLLDGEVGIANAGASVPVMKVGDGVRPWAALPDIVAAGAGADYVAGPVNTLPAGSPAEVIIDNTVSPPTISFGIPEGVQGDTGPTGPANSLTIGSVVTLPPGSPANASITGTPPDQVLNLAIPSGLPGSMALADPTGLIGLVAVPGVSLLGTRSDARHALDQAIAPIWTAMHTYTALGSGSAAILIRNAVPSIVFEETDAAATNKVFRVRSQGHNFVMEMLDDAFGNAVAFFAVLRVANVASTLAMTATTMTFAGTTLNINQTSIASTSASFVIANTNGPIIVLSDPDAATDAKRWRIRNLNSLFQIITENDAGVAVGTALQFGRVGTTVESITLAATLITFNGTTVATKLQLGSTGALSNPLLAVVASASGNAIEWGHSNVAGYRHTLGHTTTSGNGFIAFHAEHGTNANTFRTRGVLGSVIQTNSAGAISFGRLTNATADNQTPTVDLVWGATGQWGFTAPVGIGTTTTAQVLSMFGPAGVAKHIYFYSGAASRWIIRSNAIAESGSNAGSNFEILGVDDPAAIATAYLTINRATGAVTIPGSILASGGLAMPSANLTSTQPIIRFNETDAAADEKLYDITASGGDLFFRTRTDGDGAGVTWLALSRTATVINSVALSAPLITLAGQTVINSGGVVGATLFINSGAVNGPYVTIQNNGTSFADFGDGGQMGGTFTAQAFAIVARAGRAIQMAAGGSTAPHFQIAADGTVSFSGAVNIAGALNVTGVITGNSTTQALGNNTTALATTAFVQAAVPSTAARTWQTVTPASGVPVTNTTGRDLHLMVITAMPSGGIVNCYINAVQVGTLAVSGSVSAQGTIPMVCPPGAQWQVNWSGVSSMTVMGLM